MEIMNDDGGDNEWLYDGDKEWWHGDNGGQHYYYYLFI